MPSASSGSSTIFSGRTESWTARPDAQSSGRRAGHSGPPDEAHAARPRRVPSIRFEMPMKPATNGRAGRS